MEYYNQSENADIVDNEMLLQSGYKLDRDESCSSRMVVSDDDDSSSIVRAKNNGFISNNFTDIGPSSSHMITDTYNVFGGPHQVTPLIQDSEETMARKTTSANEKIDNEANLPFCLFQSTDDSQTQFSIRPRGTSEQASHMNLVDKYAVKRESTEPHDFNACQTSEPEDTFQAMKGINRIQLDVNLVTTNPHKIADTTTNSTPTDHAHKRVQFVYNRESQHDRHYLGQTHRCHKISSDKDKTENLKMPSKVARCLPRQRSRAIAIKRSRPVDFVDTSVSRGNGLTKETRQSDVELYDYATWRMYNRIIDHRRKNPLPIQHQEDPMQEQQQIHHNMKNLQSLSSDSAIDEHNADAMLHQPSMSRGPRYFTHNNVLYTADDYVSGNEDDEIFDLEL